MKKLFNLTKKTRIYNFSRKVRPLKKKIIPKEIKTEKKEVYINPELLKEKIPEKKISEKIKEYIKHGYDQKEIINLISKDNSKPQTDFQKLQKLSQISQDLTKEKEIPYPLKSELEKYNKAEQIIKNYELKNDLIKKFESTPQKIKYNEMINEIIEGKSLIDDKTLQKSLEPLLKKFKKEDIIEIEKERRNLLQNRGEVETLKEIFEKETNLKKKSKIEETLTMDEIFKEDEEDNLTLTQEQLDLERELDEYKDWNEKLDKNQIDARIEFFMKKHDMSKSDAKHMLREEFFMKKDIEKKEKIFEKREKNRERKKKMMKLAERMRRDNLEIMDYDNDKEFKRDEVIKTGKLEMKDYLEKSYFENTKKIMENKKIKQDKHDSFTVHKLQSVRNFFNYIKNFFTPVNQKALSWTYGLFINIEDVYLSNNAHFIYIFWDFSENENVTKELKHEINMRLNRYATELANKMFMDMGMRKPLNIVFIESVKRNTKNELLKNIKDDLKKKKISELKKNNMRIYKENVKNGTLIQYIDRLVDDELLEKNYNFEDLVTNLPFIKKKIKQVRKDFEIYINKDIVAKNERKKRNPDGTKKKKKKLSNVDRFWNKL